jgi:hypothetical protein
MSEIAHYKNAPINRLVSDLNKACQLGVDIIAIQRSMKPDAPMLKHFSSLSNGNIKEPNNAMDCAILFSKKMNKAGIPYAIGGSLAAGLWSIPWATLGVDMNVFAAVGTDNHTNLVRLLRKNNAVFCDINGDELQSHDPFVQRENDSLNVILWGFKFDFFLPALSSRHFSFQERKLSVQIGDDNICFLDVESICALKLLWRRSKDIPDLERLFAKNPQLDLAFIESFLAHHLRDDDDSWKIFVELKKTYMDSAQKRLSAWNV